MKILICSLLRIGDSLMHQMVRDAIKLKYADAEFMWLLNDGSATVRELLPEGDEVIFFPRKSLQDIATLKTLPVAAPEYTLRNWLNEIGTAEFDWAINLGHDKVGAYVLSEVKAKKKSGLQWNGQSWEAFANSWQQYLNDHMASGYKSDYHLCDLLLRTLDLEFEPPQATAINSNLILLQPFTSDSKKNWSIENWKRLQMWIESTTQYRAVVVGAPFEEAQLRNVFAPESIWIGGLGELQTLVDQARIVISGDTAIVHMAALRKIPSLTLSLGSSDPTKTSAFGQGHWILSANTECRPCGHRQDCTKVSHLCSEDLHPEYVENFLDYLINPAGPIRWKQSQVSAFKTVYQGGFLKLFEILEQDASRSEVSHERRSSSLL